MLSRWFILFFLSFNLAFAARAPKASAYTLNCKTRLKIQVKTNSGLLIDVPISRQDKSLAENHGLFAATQKAGLTGMSGNLVKQVPDDVTYYGLFTCKECTHNHSENPALAYNHLMKPNADGSIVCDLCLSPKTKDDGNYYRHPLDKNGKEMTGFYDAAQFTTPEAARAVMWTCSTCDSDLIVNDHPFCPSCSEMYKTKEAKKTEADLSQAATDLERTAREIKLGNSADGRAILMGEKGARKVLAGLKHLKTYAGMAKEKLLQAPQYIQEHIKVIGALLGVGMIGAATWYFYFDTTDYPGVVAETTWEKQIVFQRLTTRTGEDWCDDVPWGATKTVIDRRRVSSVLRKRTWWAKLAIFVQSLPQQFILPLAFADTDNGNGTFTTKSPTSPSGGGGSGSRNSGSGWGDSTPSAPSAPPAPVYKDWCSYSITEWTDSRVASSHGSNPKNSGDLYWPSASTQFGEREGRRVSTYARKVRYTLPDGKTKTGSQTLSDESELFEFRVGSSGTAAVNRMGTVMDFD